MPLRPHRAEVPSFVSKWVVHVIGEEEIVEARHASQVQRRLY